MTTEFAVETTELPASRSPAALAERAVGQAVEIAAGVLVAVETAILFGGVVSRYVFHRPFTWSDELASILFLWLAMLGAVVAYRRGGPNPHDAPGQKPRPPPPGPCGPPGAPPRP